MAQTPDASSAASAAAAKTPASSDAATGASASASASPPATGSGQAAPRSSHVSAMTPIHRVDDFITREDLRQGFVPADKDAPIVSFSHTLHARAKVSCEQCHHLGVKDYKAPACATCHKGAEAVATMHEACISCHRDGASGPVSCNDCHTGRQTSFAGIVRFELSDIVRGPLFIAAWALFVLGFAWRILQYVRLTRATGRGPVPVPRPAVDDSQFLLRGKSRLGRLLVRYRQWERGTVFATNPVMARVSVVFHVLLFLLPLLLPAHNILFFQSLRVSLPTLPEPFMDKVTLVLLAFGAFFLLRRILIPRVRLLTTLRDYLILLLVAAPFVTAYMAYHQWLDYRTVLVTHMIIGEIVIAAIPFTKLGHMPFLILNRFFTAGEYSWKPGNRRW
jgi:nitrate reductase gamma subunit